MNYIVFDLEWNQYSTGSQEVEGLPFEIIEIGAIKLNDRAVMIGEFSRLVKPNVYLELNQITSRLIHLQMQELLRGEPFVQVAGCFLEWCREEESIFCSWGSMDLTEFQRNMAYYHMTPLSDGPLPFLDVQKLFSLAFEDGKSRKALEYAVDRLGLEKDIPFHRAFSDAYYTAQILVQIMTRKPETLRNVSYDVFHPPGSRGQEVRVAFDGYVKYISREFDNKMAALSDREVISSKCFLCHRNLKKKLKWFTINGRHYYCLAHCEKHGYLKGKIRIQRAQDGRVYVVKTTKLVTDKEAEDLRQRSERARVLQKQGKKKDNRKQ